MRSREEMAEDLRYHERQVRDLRAQVDPLRVALDYCMPILERVAEGGTWSLEGQGGDAAREAVRLATKALAS